MALIVLLYSNCRKTNPLPNKQSSLGQANLNTKDAKIAMISYKDFQKRVNAKSLGAYAPMLLGAQSSGKGLLAFQTSQTYQGLSLETDSIKLLSLPGRNSYVFAIKPMSARANSFQNLTIDQSTSQTRIFISTFTPTPQWIANWRKGRAQTFQGDIQVMYLDSLPNLNSSSYHSKSSTNTVQSAQTICWDTYYYEEVPPVYDEPGMLATVTIQMVKVTNCMTVDDGIDTTDPLPPYSNGGGGGNSSPQTPSGFNPCDTAIPALGQAKLHQKNGVLVMPEVTPCDSVKPADSTVKDPCAEKIKVKAQANSATVAAANTAILNNLNNSDASINSVEYGVENNLNSQNLSGGYKPASIRTDGLTGSFGPNFTWNSSAGYTINVTHGHPGSSAPSPDDVYWMFAQASNPSLVAAGQDAVNFFKQNASITVVTKSGNYVVSISNWSAFATLGSASSLHQAFYEAGSQFLDKNPSSTNTNATEYALLKVFGSTINLYKAAVNSSEYKPIILNPATQKVADKPC